MNLISRNNGFNLLEMLATLSIVIILLALGINSYSNLRKKIQSKIIIEQLYHAIQLGRSEAIRYHGITTLCPFSPKTLSCIQTSQWSKGYILFRNILGTGESIQRSNIIKIYYPPFQEGSLIFQGFPVRNYLQFNAEGFTQTQNGTFRYCPKDKDIKGAKALFIIQTGRVRLSQDQDKDGIDEDSKGYPLQCP